MPLNDKVLFYRYQKDDELLKQKQEGSFSAVTIGNFDGLHLGHQHMIQGMLAHARSRNLKTVVVSFSPRPDEFFSGSLKKTIFHQEQKKKELLALGIDLLVVMSFDENLASLCASDFFHSFLLKKLSCRSLFVGPNFRFGKNKEGSTAWLETACKQSQIQLHVAEPFEQNGALVSSSRIRSLLKEKGDVKEAAKLLGRAFLLEGTVVRGLGNGKKLGFPTANLQVEHQLLPLNGVYWGMGAIGGEIDPDGSGLEPCVINIGIRPTLNVGQEQTVEVHFLRGQREEFYGSRVLVFFQERLRDEKKFAGLEELKTQIAADIQAALGKVGV